MHIRLYIPFAVSHLQNDCQMFFYIVRSQRKIYWYIITWKCYVWSQGSEPSVYSLGLLQQPNSRWPHILDSMRPKVKLGDYCRRVPQNPIPFLWHSVSLVCEMDCKIVRRWPKPPVSQELELSKVELAYYTGILAIPRLSFQNQV